MPYDSDKAPRQKHMDYSLNQGIEMTLADLEYCVCAYDIGCQFGCYHTWRMVQNSHLSYPDKLKLLFAIGELHVHGHREDCYQRFSLLYKRFVGTVAGEILESLWSRLSRMFPSAMSMTAAHRIEVYDDHMNDSNVLKLLSLGKSQWLLAPAGR